MHRTDGRNFELVERSSLKKGNLAKRETKSSEKDAFLTDFSSNKRHHILVFEKLDGQLYLLLRLLQSNEVYVFRSIQRTT